MSDIKRRFGHKRNLRQVSLWIIPCSFMLSYTLLSKSGFNITNFDNVVLDNRIDAFGIDFPEPMQDDTTKSHLSPLWQRVCTEWAGRAVCDSYVYAKQFIATKCSRSLRSLSWFLLNESKGRLHDKFEHLLPIDCVSRRLQEVLHYCFKDSALALKLPLPLITRKEVEHIQTLLKEISADRHKIKLNNGNPTINDDLRKFVTNQYKQVMIDNGGIPQFPANHSPRLMAMVGETIQTNLNTNIKMRYPQYIDKFINVCFEKNSVEEEMSRKEKSVFRWRLRQVKNVFLQRNRNDIPTTTEEIQEFIEQCDTIILEDDNEKSLSREDKIELLAQSHDTVLELFSDQVCIDILFPPSIKIQKSNGDYEDKQIESLMKAVHEHPQSLIKSAIQINNFLEEDEVSTYNIIPIVRHVVPGFFEVDTQGLWGILRSTLTNHQVKEKKIRSEWNTQTEIRHMSPAEQNQFWFYFVNFNRPFIKKGYKFNNSIKTDGFSVCIELTREDCVGMSFKPDSAKFSSKEEYVQDYDVEEFSLKTKVFIDPGKTDLLYFCSEKVNRPFPEQKAREMRNKEYEWLRLTETEWSRWSRVHQKFRRGKKKEFILQDGKTVEQEESTLSKENSKSTLYDTFYDYVGSKLTVIESTFDYYCLMIWRIQKCKDTSIFKKQKVSC
ncbi:hypothetical protein GEMRC1_010520 [Eukaryota sp. GEM-RC1]